MHVDNWREHTRCAMAGGAGSLVDRALPRPPLAWNTRLRPESRLQASMFGSWQPLEVLRRGVDVTAYISIQTPADLADKLQGQTRQTARWLADDDYFAASTLATELRLPKAIGKCLANLPQHTHEVPAVVEA